MQFSSKHWKKFERNNLFFILIENNSDSFLLWLACMLLLSFRLGSPRRNFLFILARYSFSQLRRDFIWWTFLFVEWISCKIAPYMKSSPSPHSLYSLYFVVVSSFLAISIKKLLMLENFSFILLILWKSFCGWDKQKLFY